VCVCVCVCVDLRVHLHEPRHAFGLLMCLCVDMFVRQHDLCVRTCMGVSTQKKEAHSSSLTTYQACTVHRVGQDPICCIRP